MPIELVEHRLRKPTVVRSLILLFLFILAFTSLSIYRNSQICSNCVTNQLNRDMPINKKIPHQTNYKQTLHSRASIEIYKQQLHQVQTAPFLPTYHNYRLQLKLNRTSLLTALDHSNDSGRMFNTSRHMYVTCFESESFRFNFSINFNIKVMDANAMNITWQLPQCNTSIIFISLFTSDILVLDVRQRFAASATFTFTHQWSHSNISKPFHWPIWPLEKRMNLSDRLTTVLEHSNAQQLFDTERKAIRHWLDLQYNATDSIPSIATRRLIPFEISLNTSVCSTQFFSWIDNYVQWHANVTRYLSDRSISAQQHQQFILKENIRFILYETLGSGTADRITHLITTYLIGILTNRLFLFDPNWLEFSDIIRSRLYDDRKEILPWFASDAMWKNLTVGNYRFGTERLYTDYDYEKKLLERFVIVRAHTGGLTHMLVSSKSVYRTFLTETLRMNVSNLFGCLYHALVVYRLSAMIERTSTDDTSETFGHSGQQLLQTLLSPGIYPIGIQVRTGDKFLKEHTKTLALVSDDATLKSFANFITCAQHFARGHQSLFKNSSQLPVALVVSDTLSLRRTVLRRWQYPFACLHSHHPACSDNTTGLYFLASPDPVLHVAYTDQRRLAFNLAMFDTFLLSLCEQHLITVESGFGRIGVFAALKQRNIFSFPPNQYLVCSNMSQSTSLRESGYHWSGI